jgi:hypothetical protein
VTKFDVTFSYEVYAEGAADAFRQIAERMRPKVEQYMDYAARAIPDFDRVVPSGAMTGEEHRVGGGGELHLSGWLCVISIKEHD